ncbi:PEP-CTERM sorting domain-containing protein [Akkermansiaceae bacterium]|nr:PEP-CTERM sorting domain-containing protein [bacterium]MDB4412280.1 PEP-CTERM sorting domain-containing protein [Akkermansiaceae bacterium]MDB4532569.1 PEP-CTERM sorting domain-containing protein [bacterium]
MKTRTSALLISSCAAVLPLSATVVFSNDFEDNNLDPEIGTWTFDASSANPSVVATSATGTPSETRVGLIDLDVAQTNPLGLTLGLTSAVPITPGFTAEIDFDFAARRTNGNAKTIFVDALDSSGNIVVRIVLGDSNAFGLGGGDRQRPGYDPTSAGAANTANSRLPATTVPVQAQPGSYWWGTDTSIATFDVGKDAHISLSISAANFVFSTSNQGAGVNTYTNTFDNRDSGTFAEIASVEFSSAAAGYGFWIDNVVVEGIPEPSSALLLGFAGLGFLGRRKR